MVSDLAAYVCGLFCFVSLRNGNVHTSCIEGWRYRINNKDIFSGKESHLTRSVYTILDEQGSFSQHFYEFTCVKIICRSLGKKWIQHTAFPAARPPHLPCVHCSTTVGQKALLISCASPGLPEKQTITCSKWVGAFCCSGSVLPSSPPHHHPCFLLST